MNPFPVRLFLVLSLSLGTAATAQQDAPVPIPPLPALPPKTATTVPGAVPGTTPIPPVKLPPAPAVNPAAPVATPAPAAPAAPAAPSTYTVQAGDNPWTIAKKHGIPLEELLKVNQIKDPKNLKIGDVLKLPAGVVSKTPAPAGPATPPAAKTPPAAPAPAGADWESYTIKKGDNPWKIAKTLKLDHQKILQLNPGVDFTKLSIGQEIKVPKKP